MAAILNFCVSKICFRHRIWNQHLKSPTRDCFHPDSITLLWSTFYQEVTWLMSAGWPYCFSEVGSGTNTQDYLLDYIFCLILINLCWNSQLVNFLSKTSRFSRKLRNGQWTSGHIEFLLAFLKSAPLVYPKTVVIKAYCCFFYFTPLY